MSDVAGNSQGNRRRRKRQLTAEEKYEIYLALVTGEISQNEAADRYGVDRSRDCPVDVDVATYKSEFLHHHYAGRLRPPSHYSMGWLPALLRTAQVEPGVANAVLMRPSIAAIAKRLGGIARERDLPALAPRSFTASFRAAPPRNLSSSVRQDLRRTTEPGAVSRRGRRRAG